MSCMYMKRFNAFVIKTMITFITNMSLTISAYKILQQTMSNIVQAKILCIVVVEFNASVSSNLNIHVMINKICRMNFRIAPLPRFDKSLI